MLRPNHLQNKKMLDFLKQIDISFLPLTKLIVFRNGDMIFALNTAVFARLLKT